MASGMDQTRAGHEGGRRDVCVCRLQVGRLPTPVAPAHGMQFAPTVIRIVLVHHRISRQPAPSRLPSVEPRHAVHGLHTIPRRCAALSARLRWRAG
jgi:hypothetical protein